MTKKDIFAIIAKRYGYKPSYVEKFFKLWLKLVKANMMKFDPDNYNLKDKTDINIPNFGKVVINLNRLQKYHENKENNTAEHTDTDNGGEIQRN